MPRLLSGRSVLNTPAEFHHKLITGNGDRFNDVGKIALFLLRKQTLPKCRTRDKVLTNNQFVSRDGIRESVCFPSQHSPC